LADASKDDSWPEYAAEVAAAFVCSFVFGGLERVDTNRKEENPLPPSVDTPVDHRALRLAISGAYDMGS
jgi:hypothetical protein